MTNNTSGARQTFLYLLVMAAVIALLLSILRPPHAKAQTEHFNNRGTFDGIYSEH